MSCAWPDDAPAGVPVDQPTAGPPRRTSSQSGVTLDAVRKIGVAILVVEQNVTRALEFADVGYVLVLGATVLKGNPAEAKNRHNPLVYIGKNAHHGSIGRAPARPMDTTEEARTRSRHLHTPQRGWRPGNLKSRYGGPDWPSGTGGLFVYPGVQRHKWAYTARKFRRRH